MTQTNNKLIPRFSELMQRVWNQMRTLSPPAQSDVELSFTQGRAVVILSQGQKRMGEVASLLGISLSSATKVIDRLVSKGLVKRSADPDDRRLVLCALTKAGQKHMEDYWNLTLTGTRAVAEMLDAEQLREVIKALELLENVLNCKKAESGNTKTAAAR